MAKSHAVLLKAQPFNSREVRQSSRSSSGAVGAREAGTDKLGKTGHSQHRSRARLDVRSSCALSLQELRAACLPFHFRQLGNESAEKQQIKKELGWKQVVEVSGAYTHSARIHAHAHAHTRRDTAQAPQQLVHVCVLLTTAGWQVLRWQRVIHLVLVSMLRAPRVSSMQAPNQRRQWR